MVDRNLLKEQAKNWNAVVVATAEVLVVVLSLIGDEAVAEVLLRAACHLSCCIHPVHLPCNRDMYWKVHKHISIRIFLKQLTDNHTSNIQKPFATLHKSTQQFLECASRYPVLATQLQEYLSILFLLFIVTTDINLAR